MSGPSPSHKPTFPGGAGIFFLSWCCLLLLSLPAPAYSADQASSAKSGEPLLTAEALWERAAAAKEAENWEAATALYKQYFDRFPKKELAREALWEAAAAAKTAAMQADLPDWEQVRDLYRIYSSEYPESPDSDQAFFQVGLAHYKMKFYREALIYFKFFEERYPASSLMPEMLFWRGKTFAALERFDEAVKVFSRVSQEAPEEELKFAARMELGDTQTAAKDYAGALVTFSAWMRKYPDYYLKDPALLYKLGLAYMNVGKNKDGRKNLFFYLNLAPETPLKADVLFELAESYHREDDQESALKLYGKVIEAGEAGGRAAMLARFRQAEYLDNPHRELKEWEKKPDLADPAADQPYLRVLDNFHGEPIAQDARYGLFQRYRARENFELAEEIGKAFLRYGEPMRVAGGERDRGGEILLYLVDQYLAREDYEKVYQLYSAEYRYVENFSNGRLGYLVGKALEALSLYDQAAVVYYRALALPLSEEDKADLYSRRAEVYLALKDFAAAERLLKHLRNIYENTGTIAEFYYLSGRLREEQKEYQESLEFYTRATAIQGSLTDKPQYGLGRLRMLFARNQYEEMLDALDTYRLEGWLPTDVLQEWYRRVGDVLRKRNDLGATIDAYLAAVSENMPQEGVTAQNIHLHLGDIYMSMGDMDKSRSHYHKALNGPDPLLQRIARERMNQVDIDEMLPKLETLLSDR